MLVYGKICVYCPPEQRVKAQYHEDSKGHPVCGPHFRESRKGTPLELAVPLDGSLASVMSPSGAMTPKPPVPPSPILAPPRAEPAPRSPSWIKRVGPETDTPQDRASTPPRKGPKKPLNPEAALEAVLCVWCLTSRATVYYKLLCLRDQARLEEMGVLKQIPRKREAALPIVQKYAQEWEAGRERRAAAAEASFAKVAELAASVRGAAVPEHSRRQGISEPERAPRERAPLPSKVKYVSPPLQPSAHDPDEGGVTVQYARQYVLPVEPSEPAMREAAPDAPDVFLSEHPVAAEELNAVIEALSDPPAPLPDTPTAAAEPDPVPIEPEGIVLPEPSEAESEPEPDDDTETCQCADYCSHGADAQPATSQVPAEAPPEGVTVTPCAWNVYSPSGRYLGQVVHDARGFTAYPERGGLPVDSTWERMDQAVASLTPAGAPT